MKQFKRFNNGTTRDLPTFLISKLVKNNLTSWRRLQLHKCSSSRRVKWSDPIIVWHNILLGNRTLDSDKPAECSCGASQPEIATMHAAFFSESFRVG